MSTTNLTALVASRICHDLISPVGAISNGVELLGLTGGGSEELTLISESARNASARVRFFRVAFGQTDQHQQIGGAEMKSIFKDLADDRFEITWQVPVPVARVDAQLACLGALCLEHSYPRGANIDILYEDTWVIRADGPVFRSDETLWAGLIDGDVAKDVTAKTLPFALMPNIAKSNGKTINTRFDANRVQISY